MDDFDLMAALRERCGRCHKSPCVDCAAAIRISDLLECDARETRIVDYLVKHIGPILRDYVSGSDALDAARFRVLNENAEKWGHTQSGKWYEMDAPLEDHYDSLTALADALLAEKEKGDD